MRWCLTLCLRVLNKFLKFILLRVGCFALCFALRVGTRNEERANGTRNEERGTKELMRVCVCVCVRVRVCVRYACACARVCVCKKPKNRAKNPENSRHIGKKTSVFLLGASSSNGYTTQTLLPPNKKYYLCDNF